MAWSKFMRLSLSDQAYGLIKNDIITCALEPGQQIVQHQLAQKYDLGTTPIREALQRLAQEGLVQPIPRFGYTVSYVTLSDVHEIYEFRLILEPAAARLAARQGTDDELGEIARFAELTYTYPAGESHVHNDDFHRSIALAAGNRRLHEVIFRLIDEMTRVFHLGLDLSTSIGEMRNEHLALAHALTSRNADQAEQLMYNQILRSKERVLEALMRRLGALGQSVPVNLLSGP
jgi:DNA-binding GntR family transcriptional regulator